MDKNRKFCRTNKVYPAISDTNSNTVDANANTRTTTDLDPIFPRISRTVSLRTSSTQYSQTDFSFDARSPSRESSVESAQVSSSEPIPTTTTDRELLTLYPTTKHHSFESYLQPAPAIQSEDDLEDDSDNYSDVSLQSFGCQTTKVAFKDFGCQTEVEVREFGCGTDWWLAVTNDANPLQMTYDPRPAYQLLEESCDSNPFHGRPEVIKLAHIQFSMSEQAKLKYLKNCIVAVASILIGTGIIMLVGIIYLMSYTQYLEMYLRHNIRTFIIVLLGTFHPILTGVYSLYALQHLDKLRPLYLRSAFLLTIPLSLFFFLLLLTFRIQRNFRPDFENLMKAFEGDKMARIVWDSTQTEFQCCGLDGVKDWGSLVPKSCCRQLESDCAKNGNYWEDGCFQKLERMHLTRVLFLAALTSCQFVLEVLIIWGTKEFHEKIQHELSEEEPHVLKVIFGPFTSLFESHRDAEMDPQDLVNREYPFGRNRRR